MNQKQEEEYKKLRDALDKTTLEIQDMTWEEARKNYATVYQAAQKLHELWPVLCELVEAGKELNKENGG